MKKQLRTCALWCFTLLLFATGSAFAQNVFSGEPVQWVGSPNSYSTTPYNSDYRTLVYRKISTNIANPSDGRGQWSTTINANAGGGNIAPTNMPGGGGNGWLLISGPASNRFQNKWNFNGVGQGALNSYNGVILQSGGQDMGLNMGATGYYTFNMRDAGYTNTEFYVGYTSGIPVDIAETGNSVSNGVAMVTMMTTFQPSSTEHVYVRYRIGANDFTTGTTIVEATGTGVTWTASLPACGNQVYYYVFTSTRTLAQLNGDTESQRHLAALRYDDNNGNNYTYTSDSPVTYYADADADGYGNANLTQLSCSGAPMGYVSNNTDCDDANGSIYESSLLYVDADGDGYDVSQATVCHGANAPAGYAFTTMGSDCDDDDATRYHSAIVYIDADGDAYDVGIAAVCYGESIPTGYSGSTLGTDCDDANAAKHATYPFYTDSDFDGYGAGDTTTLVCAIDEMTAPEGYSTNNTDCDDNNGSAYQTGLLYVDADGDGYGVSQAMVCYGASVPAGYSETTLGSDCDDDDATRYHSAILYIDADGDAYDGGIAAVCYGESIPSGYSGSTLGTDCDDTNAALHAMYAFYTDADFDGYGSGTTTTMVCAANAMTAPNGYSTNNTDCDDSIAAINPGHAEVPYNGVDDNCNGQLDEGMQLTTQVIAAQCGATLAAINSVIQVSGVTNATKYRYRVYKLVGGVPSGAAQIVERAQPYFTLTNLASYEYATTYRIDVEVQRNNIWLGYYGTTCDVSTPAILDLGGAGSVNPSQCGSQLATISSLIYTTSLNGVTGYRFKVTNLTDPTAPNQVQTIDRTTQWFSLPMLASYNYGTTYLIEVAVKTTGTYGGYGAGCEISTPAVPMLTSCDVHLSQPTSYVYTSSMNKATSYRFEVSLVDENDLPVSTQIVDRNIHYFNFAMVPGYVPGGKYQVRVAIRTAGWYSPYGEACYVYAPVSARNDGSAKPETLASVFDATVFPNPYSESFMLNLESTSQEKVQVRVYDMVGKLLDDRTFEHNQVELETFGARYPSGVYNIVLTQGGDVKTLRVIKR